MAADPGLQDQEALFLGYLDEVFGSGMAALLPRPMRYRIGERLLYLLEADLAAERREPTAEDLSAHRELLEQVARETGASVASVEPAVSSGLPYPRLIDLPGWELLWDIPLRRYIDSPELLPGPHCPLRWVAGVVFGHSEKRFAYLDLRHPRLKGLFSAAYEEEYGSFRLPRQVRAGFEEFLKRLELGRQELARPDGNYEWVKIGHSDGEAIERGLERH